MSWGRGASTAALPPHTSFSPAFLSPRRWPVATTVLETPFGTEETQKKTSEVLEALAQCGYLPAAIGREQEFGHCSPTQAGGMPWERAEVGHSSPGWQKGLCRAR